MVFPDWLDLLETRLQVEYSWHIPLFCREMRWERGGRFCSDSAVLVILLRPLLLSSLSRLVISLLLSVSLSP